MGQILDKLHGGGRKGGKRGKGRKNKRRNGGFCTSGGPVKGITLVRKIDEEMVFNQKKGEDIMGYKRGRKIEGKGGGGYKTSEDKSTS